MTPDEALDRVRADPALRAVLRTARDWGVSPRRFQGNEPTRRLIRDSRQQVVRVESEPEWDDDDRALAMALTLYEADACPGCGHQLSETTQKKRAFRYFPQEAIRCHYCTAQAMAAEAIEKTGQRPTSALLVPIKYVPGGD